MRFVAIALAVFSVAGCGADTVLRIDIPDPGVAPAPTSLRVTLVGVNAEPRMISPVTFPGTVVVHGVPSSVSQLCVQVDGLDDSGNIIVDGAANVQLATHRTTHATVSLSTGGASCADIVPDDLSMGGPVDMAGGGGGGGGGGLVDMATPRDLATIPICPAGTIFCDDFETGNFSKWNTATVKQDAGSIGVQSTTKAHGTYAMKALANGSSGNDQYADAEKDFTPTAPPLAIRANVYFPTTLTHFDHVIALYENGSSNNAFAIGGDNNGNWVIAENESLVPDHTSDMVPTGSGKWYCLELVIDAAGKVTFFVDNHQLIGPFPRATTGISYSSLLVGVVRSVDADYVAYIDDVAVGPSRLYCPP